MQTAQIKNRKEIYEKLRKDIEEIPMQLCDYKVITYTLVKILSKISA